MSSLFKRTEWNERPAAAKRLPSGGWYVTRNVTTEERDGATVWVGESAFMDAAEFAAYEGAKEAIARREAEVIDDYTMSLIEGGVI